LEAQKQLLTEFVCATLLLVASCFMLYLLANFTVEAALKGLEDLSAEQCVELLARLNKTVSKSELDA